GRLAGAARADDRDHLAGLDLERDLEVEAGEAHGDAGVERHRRPQSPSQRPRKPISTASDTARRTRLSANAASGRVCVRPGTLPAKVMVAPNSPSARAHVSTAPATSEGRTSGSVTRRNTV